MAENWKLRQRVDLAGAGRVTVWPEALMLPGDSRAHEWIVEVYDGNGAVALDGWTLAAHFERADGQTVLVIGEIAGNVARATMEQACYAVPGTVRATMRATKGDVTVTLSVLVLTVGVGVGSDYVDPGEVVPTLDAMLERLGAAALGAENAAYAIDNLTASAEDLPSGEAPTVTVMDVAGHKNIAIGIPRGVPGRSFNILGQYATLAELQAAVPSPTIGDQYYVGTAYPRDVYRWDGTAWINDGPMEGAPGQDGLTVSVCGVEQVDGDIPLTGADMPVSGTDATKISEALAAKATVQHFTVTLPSGGWSGSGPYTQTVTVTGMLETDRPKMDVVLSATLATRLAQKKAYGFVDMGDSADGSFTVTCDKRKPGVDLTVQLEVTR